MRNFLLVPLRLAIGWGLSPRLLGMIGVTMLVLLRVTIGWHFHSEGVEKYRQGDWDAAPFFANAKGPFADHFHNIVWDHKGEYRRAAGTMEEHFQDFIDQAAVYYTLSDEQVTRAGDVLKATMESHKETLEEYAGDLEEFDLGLERLEKMKADAARTGVESLAGQIETVRKENNDKLKPVMNDIDELWDGFEAQITAIGMENFYATDPPAPLVLQKFRTARIDTSMLNKFVPFFDLAIGWCLLLGLFTPVAALAAAGFLGSVFLSQYPPATGPSSSMYQLIECMACLVLAGTGAGRFAGLDYFLQLFVRSSEAEKRKSGAA